MSSPAHTAAARSRELIEEDVQKRTDALIIEMLQRCCSDGEVRCFTRTFHASTLCNFFQIMSVYRVLEHASPALVNVAPPGGSAPIFAAIAGQHW